MVFIDTGYLIALGTESDELHERALAWSGAINERVVVTDYVLLEIANHFHAPRNRERAAAVRHWLSKEADCEIVRSSPELFDAGWKLYEARPDKFWSLTDCISFLVMGERRITRALAHDIHFEQAGFVALLRRDP